MPKGRGDTRATILEAAYKLFYRRGYSRVGVDEIAEAASVTKRTLYYHFESKDAVLTAMLERQHELATRDMLNWASTSAATPGDYVRQLFSDMSRWAAKRNFSGSGFSRIVMELADLRGHPARSIARRHKAAIEAAHAGILRRLGLADPEQRARDLAVLLEGALMLTLVHGGRAYIDAAERTARRLVST